MDHGFSRGRHHRRNRAAAGVFALLTAGLAPSIAGSEARASADESGRDLTVIVRFQPGSAKTAEAAVVRLGGTHGQPLTLIDGFSATVREDRIDDLAASAGVTAVTPDGQLQLLSTLDDYRQQWMADIDQGPFSTVTKEIGAQAMWARTDRYGMPYTGKGIGVALIDSGTLPIEGLNTIGKVVNGPDLSVESQIAGLNGRDSFGHGTHMAGIIGGRDPLYKLGGVAGDFFVGVAPGSTLINLKVAAADGATDISQVIAAIDWVVTHRSDPGLNIRVLNLSFGASALQPYQLDPLSFAVEQAWLHGIVVVVAAGNDGTAGTTLNNPAFNPYVIAVGAADHAGTASRSDDTIAPFSSVGQSARRPDLVAPGRSITSLRAPMSWIDDLNPIARSGVVGAERFFRGSGTSQAAAVTSGAVALLLDERPELTPDQVKYVLKATADKIPGAGAEQGAGLIDLVGTELIDPLGAPVQKFEHARGTGSLELSRGGNHITDVDGVALVGEFDIFAKPWNPSVWSAASAAGTAWVGGVWNGTTWSGDGWNYTWLGKTWRSAVWANDAWSGKTWRDESWAGKTWRDGFWDGKTWRDGFWDGKTWRSDVWSGKTWRGDLWTGVVWR